MSKKDVMAAIYLRDPSRFADLINGHCFEGEMVIHPEDVQEMDSTQIYTGEKKYFRRYQDLTRKVVYKAQFVVISVEEQSQVDYTMPIRVMEYDVGRYEQQLQDKRREHRKKKDLSGKEFLSGISKADRFWPVITIVLYFGKHWDGARSLQELLELDALPPQMRKFVADYPLYLIEEGSYPYIERFQTDLRLVFGFLQNADDKEKLRRFAVKEKEGLSKLAEEAYDLISVFSENKELEKLKKNRQTAGKGTVNMFKGLNDMLMDAREEGKAEGKTEGKLEGKLEGKDEGRAEERRKILQLIQRGYSVEELQKVLEKENVSK